MKSPSDEQLIEAYLAGEADAHTQMSRWIQMVVDSRHWGLSHLRDDIRQEIHRRLVQNLSQGRFRASSSLKTYVVQVSKYTCIEFLRQKIRSTGVGLDSAELRDTAPGPEQKLASSEWTHLAKQAIAGLPTHCRELFDMIFAERLPYQEISRRLGVAEGTIKSRIWRCRDQLAKFLKEKGILHPP